MFKPVTEFIRTDNVILKKVIEYRTRMVRHPTTAEKMFFPKLVRVLKAIPLKKQYIERQQIFFNFETSKAYIVDFFIPSLNLIVEVDGGYHFTDEARKKDILRTKDLNESGFKIIRFNNYTATSRWIESSVLECFHDYLESIPKEKETVQDFIARGGKIKRMFPSSHFYYKRKKYYTLTKRRKHLTFSNRQPAGS